MITFTARSSAISLPSPRLGDREKLDLRTVYKRMMDGSIVSYIKGPVVRVVELEFENLNRPKVAEFINFLDATVGQTLIYKDYRDKTWKGKILNYPFEAVHAAIRNNNFQIVFEGTSVG